MVASSRTEAGHRQCRTDQRPRRKTAALTSSLIVQEEKSSLCLFTYRSTKAPAENVCFTGGRFWLAPFRKYSFALSTSFRKNS